LTNLPQRLIGVVGLVALLGIAWALSKNRRRFPLRIVLWGLGLQIALALLILKTAAGQRVFEWANDAFTQLIKFTDEGANFVFGDWGARVRVTDVTKPEEPRPHVIGFAFAFRVLPVIVFFGALMSVLYHLGVMQKVVAGMAWVMRRCMRVSGAEALVAATEVFVGMTEAPLAIRPYVPRLTQSELLAIMTTGLANIAGSVLAIYVGYGAQAGHLLCASVMSAPAALLIAKIMLPETGEPETSGIGRIPYERTTTNVIDAAAAGAADGLRLALNVGAMLVAFLALLAMLNYFLAGAHGLCERYLSFKWFPESIERIFGWLFWPLSFLMGVEPKDAETVGSLMGVKTGVNELVAYGKLGALKGVLSERSFTIATYALCGFANFGSLAIQIGGVSALAPERRADISRLSLRALAGGSLATFMTATIAGILL